MTWLFLLLALIAGIGLTFQVGINNQLRQLLGEPLLATLTSFIIGTIALAAVALIVRVSPPSASRLAAAPWWVWSGGLIGAVYIMLSIVLAPKIGAAALLSLTVAGQMLASLVLDHYGALGFPSQPLSIGRFAGAVLILTGVILIRRF